METIALKGLKKYFRVFKRREGLIRTFASLFKRKYSDVKAVDDISFTIKEGELVGFIGPNGAGKTTTLKCLSGLLYPSSGNVDVLGFKPFERKNQFLKSISLVMGQKNQLWWDLPAVESFRLNKEIYELDETTYQKNLNELMELLEVGTQVNQPVRSLSLGQRMKMELIAALIHHPKVLFLDEPTIGLDIVMQKKMRDFLGKYNQKYQATILLTSHYMADVKELCRRVIIINNGKLIYDGNLDKLSQKYSHHKIITAHFDNSFDRQKLSKLGEIKSIDENKVILHIKKVDTRQAAVTLLEKFKVRDLNIEEPELEDVISIIFEGKSNV
ncbi:ABC transporter [Candidatus Gottesmanbacteria bacterium RBG_16_37_8]|uniref:ABC transporter n=1 Tax=Candidatus Gottesmanbacteria bacterium RBG_16_37_8 TaxID=1798371 RepID=A0A1F5YRD4_9BACT|nr:MAG: ABC transporter [Candidatus Gottesmanbacteria bacterium RBG_16_37_8]